jgi:hypothetical protein
MRKQLIRASFHLNKLGICGQAAKLPARKPPSFLLIGDTTHLFAPWREWGRMDPHQRGEN